MNFKPNKLEFNKFTYFVIMFLNISDKINIFNRKLEVVREKFVDKVVRENLKSLLTIKVITRSSELKLELKNNNTAIQKRKNSCT